MPAPPIDSRSAADLIDQAERLLQRYSDWQRVAPVAALLVGRVLNEDVIDPVTGLTVAVRGTLVDQELAGLIAALPGLGPIRMVPLPDAGTALVRAFARLMEVLLERLNRVPDKNLLAFLDLVGVDLLPPQAARVPLTFQIASGAAVDALVPAGTQVSAVPTAAQAAPVLFETESELVVTRSRLVAVLAREPAADRYGDHSVLASAANADPVALFQGDQPVGHDLYLGHDRFLGMEPTKPVMLRIGPAEGTESWLAAVAWAGWDGAGWVDFEPTGAPEAVAGAWELTLPQVPPLARATVGGYERRWLRGRLRTPLPPGAVEDVNPATARRDLTEQGLTPSAGFSGDTAMTFEGTLYPFGRATPSTDCHLASDQAFDRPGARVDVAVTVDPAVPADPSTDLELAWEFSNGTAWQELGRSSPASASTGSSTYGFADETLAFTRTGQIRFVAPACWTTTQMYGQTHRWLRIRIRTGSYLSSPAYQPPAVTLLTIGYRWQLPRIDTARARVEVLVNGLTPPAALANLDTVDPAGQFLPFGQKPAFGDTLHLDGGAALDNPGALVGVTVTIGNPRHAQAAWPLPPVRASRDLRIAWEYWNGTAWAALGTGTPLPADLLLEPVTTPFEGDTLTLTGEAASGTEVTVQEKITGSQVVGVFQLPDAWTAGITGITPGVHAYRVATKVGTATADARAVAVFRGVAGSAPVPLTLLGVPGITGGAQITVTVTAPVVGGRVLVYNATTDGESHAPLTDPFVVPVSLAEGRNDLLVLVYDAAGRAVGAEVVPVVRDSAHAADDFQDTTWGFTRSGRVSFRAPADAAARDLAGRGGRWMRARVASGNYGTEASYQVVTDAAGNTVVDPTTSLPVYQLVPASFRPPTAGPVLLDYHYAPSWEPLDAVVSDNGAVVRDHTSAAAAGTPFSPYLPTEDTDPTCYLGLRPPDAAPPFTNRSAALYAGVAEAASGAPAQSGQLARHPPSLAWEYWNGTGWVPLGVRDESLAFTRRGLVRFIGPADWRASLQFGTAAHWLRARWTGGEYPSPPMVRQILTNTTWATQTRTSTNQVLGSSTGKQSQVFVLPLTPVLPGQQIQIREPEMPSAADLEVLTAEEGEDAVSILPDQTGQATELWVRWHHVTDFYQSTPRSRHYVLDRLTGQVRFGDGDRGLIPPRGTGNVRAGWYQAGGGTEGNLPAGSLTQLKTAVPYVDSVVNWEAAGGGCAAETLDSVRTRGPATLRHRDRAVAIADFEDLARQASTEVARVKGIPAASAAQAGEVTLIVVPNSTGPRPEPDLTLLDTVATYVQRRLCPTVALHVEGPAWVRVEVTATVVPVSLQQATEIQAAVESRIEAFLHPLTGGPAGQGWAFGRLPHRSELFAVVESVPGIDHVHALAVTSVSDDSTPADRFLLYSGSHHITMLGQAATQTRTEGD